MKRSLHCFFMSFLLLFLWIMDCNAQRVKPFAPNFEVCASCYPWQVHDETIGQILDNVTELAGVNAIYLVGLMHKEHRPFATDKFPLNPVRPGWDVEDSRVYWHPDFSLYGKIKPMPSDSVWLRETDWLKLLVDSAHARGLKAGVEISHTPIPASILKKNPAYQQQDINGNLKGGICPNNPDVREYLLALFSDLAKNYDVDWIQTCMYLYGESTCFCPSCQKEAKASNFDLAAAIPVLQANPNAQPQLNDWIIFRRNSVTKIYRLISDRIHHDNPGCDFRLNDVGPWSSVPDSLNGLYLQDLKPSFNSCVIQDHTEQIGRKDETFSMRKDWLTLNRSLLGNKVSHLSSVAARMAATPELIKKGIQVAVDQGVDGIAIKHYDGSVYSQLRAVRNGLSAAKVPRFKPVFGIEAENMTLSGYTQDKCYNETCIKTDGEGVAKSTFNGQSGIYNVVVSYTDEIGNGKISFFVGNNLKASWILNEDVSCWRRKTIPNTAIRNGDEIKIVGIANGSDHARVDFIELNYKEPLKN